MYTIFIALLYLNMFAKHLWLGCFVAFFSPDAKTLPWINALSRSLSPTPIKKCALWGWACDANTLYSARETGAKKQNGTANKRACIQARPSHCPTQGPQSNVRRLGLPPFTRLEEPNRKSKFSGRMGQAQSSSPLGPAERGVKKELLRACRRLMQWIVFLLPAPVSP